MHQRHRTFAGCLAACALTATAQTHAYPDQPVTLVIPISAGGDANGAARALAFAAQKTLGQPLVPVNRAGASGAIGSIAVRNAKPDGYSLLAARVGSQAVLPALQPTAGYK